jgi:hypothetical protein
MLSKMEEMLEMPLSADECQSAEESLSSLESTLSMGVIPAIQIKDARERIRKLRQKLSQAKVSPAAGKKEQGGGLLEKCGGCGSNETSDLEVVRDKNNKIKEMR